MGSSPCDTVARFCARPVLCWLAFPSAPALGSTDSAADRSAAFTGFTATTAGSDFSRSCIIGYGSSPSRCGPWGRRVHRPNMRPPRFRRLPFVRDVFFDHGRASVPRIAGPHMLPSTLLTGSASAVLWLSRLNSTPHTIAVYASHPPAPATTQHSLPGARYGLPGPVSHRQDHASFAWRTSNPFFDQQDSGLLRSARNDVPRLVSVMTAFADDRKRALLHHRGGLAEQQLALFLGADCRLAEIRIDLFGHCVGAHRGRPLADGLEPALEMRKVVDVLALVLVPHHPGIARHIRDRITAGDELAILETLVEHAVEPVGFVHIAIDGVFDFFLGVIAEVMVLPRHRTEPAHLPERPLNRVVTAVDVGGKEFSGLLRQIQQHRAGFEDRNRLAAALRLMIEHCGNAVVGRDRQKLRLELVALADVDRENLVLQPGLFQKHRDLVAVRRGPVMEVDHGASPFCCGFMPGIQIEGANWMRLHGLHRIMNAKSMAGVSHPGELICNTA